MTDALVAEQTLPPAISVPGIGDVPLRAEASSWPTAHSFTAAERPVRPGASVSPVGEPAGTTCAIVRRPVGVGRAARYLLSCEHVLFPSLASDTPQPVLQPASSDGALYPGSVVGHQFARGGLIASGINDIDAAIVQLKGDIRGANQPLGEVFTLSSLPIGPAQGQPVTLYGRSSGRLRGAVVDASTDTSIAYESQYGRQVLRFRRLVRCAYDSPPRSGDSGAPVVLSGTNRLLGMHIGGADQFGFFCRIEPILRRLQIDLH